MVPVSHLNHYHMNYINARKAPPFRAAMDSADAEGVLGVVAIPCVSVCHGSMMHQRKSVLTMALQALRSPCILNSAILMPCCNSKRSSTHSDRTVNKPGISAATQAPVGLCSIRPWLFNRHAMLVVKRS